MWADPSTRVVSLAAGDAPVGDDGAVRWLSDRGACVARDEEGRPHRFVGAIADITDQISREDADTEQLIGGGGRRARRHHGRIPKMPTSAGRANTRPIASAPVTAV